MGHLSTPLVEHLQALRLSCVIAHLRRYVAFLASWLVLCPLLRQRQAEVEQDMVVVRDVAHEHADLAVVHLAPVATPLALSAHRMRPALGEATGVEGDDAIGFAQPLCHLSDNTVTKGRCSQGTVPMQSWMTWRSTSTNVAMSSACFPGKWDSRPWRERGTLRWPVVVSSTC